ncbi:AAA family ATPase [Chryseobacterium sp. OV279]|uniref:AAA family ATPase n=1 Tax=Chryseobacterium sp. OV279 TaxID=1500285 RepID=UPI00091530D0|nr:AAA family ATPase [Chryseobacterium sp. OV279]SHE78619.1 ATPase/GTPase, AAA15 family [Chryseobacterium sp. OV279]
MDKYISKHIDRLMLDPNNYRFIDNKDYVHVSDDQISEKRIQDRSLSFLIGKNEDNISDLVTSFKSNGILKLDPIQVKELPDNNYLVIEGNRRTAALKYLYEQYKKSNDVGKLTESDFKSVELVLISEESPIQHLITMGLHHISGKKKWSPVNQAQLIQDLKIKHKLTEEEICNSLAINKHNLRRSLRILSLIEGYKRSDYGDQFQTNMFSVFEEVIKNVKMKAWLEWNDTEMRPTNLENEEKLFSWISKDESIEEDELGNEQQITLEPIITKSHEIRELSKFINEPKAVEQMEEARSIAFGFVFSDAVGESRLRNALETIQKEVNSAFQFSEFMNQSDYTIISKLRNKLDKLLPTNSNIELTESPASIYFNSVESHFNSVNIIQYRKLHNIQISNLSRVNIFAGGNNTGKTSLLEIFFLFTRLNSFKSVIDLERFRGRFYQDFPTKWFNKIFVDSINIQAEFNDIMCSVNIIKKETNEDIDKSHYLTSIVTDANVNGDNFSSTIHLFDNKDPEFYYEKSQFLCQATFSSPYRYDGQLLKRAHAKAVQEKYFDEIMLFINENLDKNIEKIEMISIDNESRFMVSSTNNDVAIDITKYGEGLQRVFEIALLMGYSRNGVICIDELDSAIHKNLLVKFTEFIQKLAQKFNVQVFLSTHSKECIDAFVENGYPDNELMAYAITEEDGKLVAKFLEGNKLKHLVESINIDIR